MDNSSEELLLKQKKEKALNFLKLKSNWLIYALLALLFSFACWIRSLNISGLRDISTGGWALGPDLDPWLFTRWAKEIVENGALTAIDSMRYVPLGFETKGELIFLPYLMAYFHKVASLFGSTSVEQSSALFPVFMFGLTVISFFLFARKVFTYSLGIKKANIVALLSAFYLSIIPALLPRTIAGIPEKESAAFFFMFLTFYFFLLAWESKNIKLNILFALLSGLSTAAMTLIWGGVIYVYYTITVSMLIAFFLNKINNTNILIPIIWVVSTFSLVIPFTNRLSFISFFTSIHQLILLFVILSFFVQMFISYRKLPFIENTILSSVPKPIVSALLVLVLGLILSLIFLGPGFIIERLAEIKGNLITPVTSRLGVTVAENRQPFFNEWAGSFGPNLFGLTFIPLLFWLFFFGSITLVYFLFRHFDKKHKIIITSAYTLFLLSLIFSRYKPDHFLNGTNLISLTIYLIGFLILIGVSIYIYHLSYKNQFHEKLKELDFGIILLLVLFILSITSTRGAVRLIMVLVPPVSIIISYLIVTSFYNFLEDKGSAKESVSLFLAVIIIFSTLYSGYVLYNETYNTAKNYAPNIYNQQWQLAMSWVRANTTQEAVFAHWWDYGYWLQSIGNRATVLDGGNAISYWNYLMGRYALTGTSDKESLEFLYTHNVTHFLIDSTDIGKYGAFSSIGSDPKYDRRSYIPTLGRDSSQKQETKNGTIYIYNAGMALDGDIIYEENGSKIFLPEGKAGLAAVTVELSKDGKILSQPRGIFVYKNNQYNLPLRYGYQDSFIDFKSGLEAGIFMLPVFNGQAIDNTGSMLYLSSKTVKSQLARLYLYEEDNNFFKLVHSEDDFLIRDLKRANLIKTDFVLAGGGLRGPIRIWGVNYPSNVEANPAYLNTTYPSKDIQF